MSFIGRMAFACSTIVVLGFQLAVPAAAEERIGIAVIAPLSGPLAKFGDSLVLGARAAATQLNASRGIMDKKIDIIVFDDGGAPSKALEQARRAVEADQIQFVIGHMTRETALATSRFYAQHKVLQIEPRGSRMPSDAPGGETLFNLCGADGTGAEVVKNYLAKQFKTNVTGTVSENDNISRSTSSRFADTFSKIGGRVVGSESADSRNIQSGINRVEGQGAGAAFVELVGDASYTSKLMDVSHVSAKVPVIVDVPPYVATGYVPSGVPSSTSSWLFLLQEVDQGVGITPPLPDVARLQNQSTYASNSFLFGYAAVQVVAKGAEEARSFEPDRIAAWLRSGRSTSTILGDVHFDGAGQGSISRFAIYGFGKGQLRPDGTEVHCDSGCPCKDGGCGCTCPKK